jgi:hypothetical protein
MHPALNTAVYRFYFPTALGVVTYGMHTKVVDYQGLLLDPWIRIERSI